MTHAQRKHDRRRRGLLTFEMMFVLPVLLIAIFGLTEFAFLFQGYQAVTASANVGVRQGILPSADLASVEQAASDALAGWVFQDDIKVLAYVNGVRDDGVNNEVLNAVTGDQVTVEVQLLYGKAAPNLLKFVGLDLSENRLITSFTMIRE
jgi:Flp pilus assembly protein TadG